MFLERRERERESSPDYKRTFLSLADAEGISLKCHHLQLWVQMSIFTMNQGYIIVRTREVAREKRNRGVEVSKAWIQSRRNAGLFRSRCRCICVQAMRVYPRGLCNFAK